MDRGDERGFVGGKCPRSAADPWTFNARRMTPATPSRVIMGKLSGNGVQILC
jgi:hypothetical protein